MTERRGAGRVYPADQRFVTEQPGIRTWHAFSSGPHYDPSNLSFGPVVGCDEHLVAPGAGFDWHAHRGVVIVSWVLAGTLRHEDDGGAPLEVEAGELLVQSAGDGIRHRETNASERDELRFVQTTLLLDLGRSVLQPALPARVGELEIDVATGIAGLAPGDSVRDGRVFTLASSGARLLVRW